MSRRRKLPRENVMSMARALLSHIALMALPRHVATARTTANRTTTPIPPHVKGPQG